MPAKPSAEVLAAAKESLNLGNVLDSGGGCTLYGVAERAEIAKKENRLPLGLTENIKVVKRVHPDGILTYDDVELDEDLFLLKLRRMQDKMF